MGKAVHSQFGNLHEDRGAPGLRKLTHLADGVVGLTVFLGSVRTASNKVPFWSRASLKTGLSTCRGF